MTEAANEATTSGAFCTSMSCSSEVKQVCKKDKLKTSTFCQTTYVIVDGKVNGRSIFVATGCDGNRACPTGQDPIYYWPGVSSDETFPQDLWDKPDIAKPRAPHR